MNKCLNNTAAMRGKIDAVLFWSVQVASPAAAQQSQVRPRLQQCRRQAAAGHCYRMH